jgi:hypothetical protein
MDKPSQGPYSVNRDVKQIDKLPKQSATIKDNYFKDILSINMQRRLTWQELKGQILTKKFAGFIP